MRATASLVLGAVFLSSLAIAGCDDPEHGRIPSTSLLVQNNSDYAIVELYLTDVGSPSWGRNRLGTGPLNPGEEILLGAPCGFYDALLVDEDGVDCEVLNIDLCHNDAVWVIENETCTVFEASERAN